MTVYMTTNQPGMILGMTQTQIPNGQIQVPLTPPVTIAQAGGQPRTLNKSISKLCVLNTCISEHSNIYVTPCMAVDGFPQPAFDGLWPRQDRTFRPKKNH
jgi:hypothetical protein